jgi:hypothetical protein
MAPAMAAEGLAGRGGEDPAELAHHPARRGETDQASAPAAQPALAAPEPGVDWGVAQVGAGDRVSASLGSVDMQQDKPRGRVAVPGYIAWEPIFSGDVGGARENLDSEESWGLGCCQR